jgi:aminopeptidase N
MRFRRVTTVAVAFVSLVGLATPAAAAGYGGPTVGAPGLGDPFFPNAGNGGYDVEHYDLNLAWDPASGELSGTAVIEAKATQNLTQFNLDFREFEITSLKVNEAKATFTRDGQELIITPKTMIRRRSEMEITVKYRGVPKTVIDPDGALDGWIPTPSGGVIALSEPQGAPSWFPVNDYPTDKATYSIAMTVPNNLSAISNGRLAGKETRDGKTMWKWKAAEPMASYLSTMAIGAFEVTTGTTTQGIPFVNAIEPVFVADSAAAIARTSEIIDWEASLYGPYPFNAMGVIAVDAPDVGYALETQTRPGFTTAVDESTYVHEIAHQWVGNSVSLTSFPEMWLNEGFAQYTEKLWAEREGTQTTQAWFDETYATAADDELWTDAPAGLPGPEVLFSRPVYDRGAMTLHQLRVKVGDDTFFKILRKWSVRNRDSNVTTKQFIELAERISGKKLGKFFKTWLYTPGKPALPLP